MSNEQSNSQESTGSISYVTRGARMHCDCGSHTRRLNIINDHGWIINHYGDDYNHPIANEDDYKENVNIKSFGICGSSKMKSNNTITLYAEGEGESDDAKTVTGSPCTPLFDTKWQDTKEDSEVNSETDGKVGSKMLTTNSCLVCRYGGIIQFISSGLEYEGELDK